QRPEKPDLCLVQGRDPKNRISAWYRAETRKTFGFSGSLRSSNGQRHIRSSKLGRCVFVHLTLPFSNIITYSSIFAKKKIKKGHIKMSF
ncbi:MAG: hypothetical protein NC331_13265, partial [Lachnospiraceae bacterium]|nr:hypothetical protein [Lachnospiraceae bacterium]